MRAVELWRYASGPEGTLGVLRGAGLAAETMEPPWRENRRNLSCIPVGAYEVRPHISPRFGRALLVSGAPGRSHILFHAGNLGGDIERGLRTHTRGCILPGQSAGRLQAGGRTQRAVLASRTAMRLLLAWAGDAGFTLRIHGGESA